MAKARFSTLDLYVSAYLCLHGLEPDLELQKGKVIFTFETSDRLYGLMNRFNGNEAVPVADFTTAIKALRGRMLSLKEGMAGNVNGGRHGPKTAS